MGWRVGGTGEGGATENFPKNNLWPFVTEFKNYIFFIKKSKALSVRLKHVFISPNLRMYYFENVMNIVENIWSKWCFS